MTDDILSPDTNFHAWQLDLVAAVNLNLANYILVAVDMTAVTAALGSAIRTMGAKVQSNPAGTNPGKASQNQ